ncbi:hypothetical protein GGD61_008161 [Bradyrhizobium sp. SBR1B]|nr:hypothetical protein [Bradyrhizobium sp. SBR1B]
MLKTRDPVSGGRASSAGGQRANGLALEELCTITG